MWLRRVAKRSDRGYVVGAMEPGPSSSWWTSRPQSLLLPHPQTAPRPSDRGGLRDFYPLLPIPSRSSKTKGQLWIHFTTAEQRPRKEGAVGWAGSIIGPSVVK